jgi:hypothetical protein
LDFIQKYFLVYGEHHDRQNPNWELFQLIGTV